MKKLELATVQNKKYTSTIETIIYQGKLEDQRLVNIQLLATCKHQEKLLAQQNETMKELLEAMGR